MGDIADLGLARRVLDQGLAGGERRREQDVMRRAHRDLREDDVRAFEALGRPRQHVAAVDVDLGAEGLEALGDAGRRDACRWRSRRVAKPWPGACAR